MATTYTTTKTAVGSAVKDFKAGTNWITATYTIAAALVINDVFQMTNVPIGARVVEIVLSTTDLDSNGTPLITLDVGDGGDVDRYIAASVIGQTGGTIRLGQGITTNTMAYTYTVDDTIDVMVKAAPATSAVTGTITLSVGYTTDL